ncbi:MAG: NAD-dependent epimerase/dehydratase family protein [Acidimicrobiales bacterium]
MTQTAPVTLVTGGAGFIGSHMVDLLLANGHRVRVIDNLAGGREANLADHARNPDLDVAWRDIRAIDPGDALFAGVDQVVHFAGIGDIVPSLDRPTEYMDVNAQGTVRVLEAARAASVRKLAYAASSSCYGLAAVPTTESHPIDPHYPYALSKHHGEQAVLHWHRVYGMPVASIRIFNAYGTRSRTSGAYGAVIGVFLRQKLAGRPFTVVGDGTQRRDFVYASDVAAAFLAAVTSERACDVWNVGAGNPQSVNRLVELLGGDTEHLPKRPGEPGCTWADISRIRADLGWSPTISFEAGIARVVADIEHWRDAPLWDADSIADATRTWFANLTETIGDGRA